MTLLLLWLKLNFGSWNAKVRAIEHAGEMDDRRAWQMALDAVLSKPALASHAITALVKLGNKRAVAELVNLGRNESYSHAVVNSLHSLGDAQAICGLITLLEGRSNCLARRDAAHALHEITMGRLSNYVKLPETGGVRAAIAIPKHMRLRLVRALRQVLLISYQAPAHVHAWSSVTIHDVRRSVIEALDAIDRNWLLSDQDLDTMVKQLRHTLKDKNNPEGLGNAVDVLGLLVERHAARIINEHLNQISKIGELHYSDSDYQEAWTRLPDDLIKNAKAELARRAGLDSLPPSS
jgi:hypothetical protein